MFTDGFKRSRPWIAITPREEEWRQEVKVPVNAEGFPLQVPFGPEGYVVTTLLYDSMEGHYPRGNYRLIFEGAGLLKVSHDAQARTFNKAGNYPVRVNPSDRGIRITILRSSAKDPIRNIRFVLPGFEERYQQQPIHPAFLQRVAGFKVLRFAQTMTINDGEYPCDGGEDAFVPACTMSWAHRASPRLASQMSKKGIAFEWAIDVANAAKTDFWPGIIHAADDSYFRGMARLIRDRLDPSLKIYLELSNEVWNFSGPYPQHDYFRNRGSAEGLYAKDMPSDVSDAGRRYFIKRSARLFEIFEEEFRGQTQRLVKVIPGHMGNPWHSERMLEHMQDKKLNPRGIKADAVAVGAYFGGMVADQILAEKKDSAIDVDQILRRVRDSLYMAGAKEREDTFEAMVIDHGKVAQKHHVELISYEGGPHLIPSRAQEGPILDKIIAASRHPQMERIYREMFALWFKHHGGLFVAYSLVDKPGKFSTFGHLEYMDQPAAQAPKFRALQEQILKAGGSLQPASPAAVIPTVAPKGTGKQWKALPATPPVVVPHP